MKVFDVTDSFSLNAKKSSYDLFAKLQTDLLACDEREIDIRLNIETRFGYTFVFLLATLPFLAQTHHKTIRIFCNEKSFTLFKRVGFLKKECLYDPSADYSSLLMAEANVIEKDEDIFETVTEITNEAPVEMSLELSSLFISKAFEIMYGGVEHD